MQGDVLGHKGSDLPVIIQCSTFIIYWYKNEKLRVIKETHTAHSMCSGPSGPNIQNEHLCHFVNLTSLIMAGCFNLLSSMLTTLWTGMNPLDDVMKLVQLFQECDNMNYGFNILVQVNSSLGSQLWRKRVDLLHLPCHFQQISQHLSEPVMWQTLYNRLVHISLHFQGTMHQCLQATKESSDINNSLDNNIGVPSRQPDTETTSHSDNARG